MKKILLIAALMASTAAFAEGQLPVGSNVAAQQQQQTSTSEASNSANQQTVIFEAADNTLATREAGAADIQVALIQAAAARDVAGTTAVIRNTPSMNGPALVSSNDTCMGSASGAVSAPGFGLSLGKTYNDTNCVMLKNSRELWNMGMKAAALALMCNDSANKEALELTGFVCPQTEKANKQAAAAQAPAPVVAKTSTPAATTVASSGYTGNDPIIKARLGLK